MTMREDIGGHNALDELAAVILTSLGRDGAKDRCYRRRPRSALRQGSHRIQMARR
jgi:hypothetical protein